ncbi:hypothetical protein FOB58_003927 [Candida parapsilosis]|uniref:Matrin-type domain-containing protein n=2 Tax=Candida parapsilosis TaxID=5480 RepID=G8B9Q3_CANPC|nr:uncharacterized protein CPAR2_303430 [Candida parapsilosis]KAF6044289.1 hypothetical protein FOB60_005382 [Candida parapsilosis]KAF6047849.1 hypothetical protein FOB58_003927 [Candida parapsilosis]KAF6050183.1 hypothetical protein FOB59_002429 [Candida parapsilosis]KAF6061303.1 hypothetical protein FOB61_004060 [Candida parapsilosis]KAI5905188.1 Pre-mRNA-splicing factor sap61 [Candida parapsilosis]
MCNSLEKQRSALESLDAIEVALSRRFLRNPDLLPKTLRPKHGNILTEKRRVHTKRLFRLQQHELKQLSDEYNLLLKQASASFDNVAPIKQDLQNLKEEDDSLVKFDNLIAPLINDPDEGRNVQDTQSKYSLFGSADPKDIKIKFKKGDGKEITMARRKALLSSAASHLRDIEINDILDLKEFHQYYNKYFSSSEVPYVQYLYSFHKFPYEKVNQDIYRPYLKSLYELLKRKHQQLYPLSDTDHVLETIDTNINRNPNQNEASPELYCAICDKHFATETVYKAHLESKKHLKKASKIEGESNKNKPNAWYEQAIKIIAGHLEEVIHQTEKYLVSSERARFNENQDELDIENEYTEVDSSGSDSNGESNSDSETDADADLFKNLPLGTDGTPIPFWLYKLQGLHKTYTCEICGNIGYKGKQAFERHFSGSKHQKGLQLLGIAEDMFPYFKNISSIDEAQKLMQNLKKELRTKQSEIHDAIEVEDKQGNVMSYLDYLDLKKQGLI